MISIGVDPGLSGGICIINSINKKINVYMMPTVMDNKKKRRYHLIAIINILNVFVSQKDILLTLENVHTRPGEGNVSAFNFGRGFGNLEGIFTSLFRKEPNLISPQSWKKYYPQLETENIKELRGDTKKIRDILKKIKLVNKNVKDKSVKKKNKIQIVKNEKSLGKLNRKIRSEAKNEARFLAMKLAPNIKDEFKRTKDDGKAESLLIARYALEI